MSDERRLKRCEKAVDDLREAVTLLVDGRPGCAVMTVEVCLRALANRRQLLKEELRKLTVSIREHLACGDMAGLLDETARVEGVIAADDARATMSDERIELPQIPPGWVPPGIVEDLLKNQELP